MDFLEQGSRFSLFDVKTGPVRAIGSVDLLLDILRAEAEESPEHISSLRVISFDLQGRKLASVSAEELLRIVGGAVRT